MKRFILVIAFVFALSSAPLSFINSGMAPAPESDIYWRYDNRSSEEYYSAMRHAIYDGVAPEVTKVAKIPVFYRSGGHSSEGESCMLIGGILMGLSAIGTLILRGYFRFIKKCDGIPLANKTPLWILLGAFSLGGALFLIGNWLL